MALFDWLLGKADPAAEAEQAAASARLTDITTSLRSGRVPTGARERLEGVRAGNLPWLATLTPAELQITRSHGMRPIAAISATCWLHFGWSWTEGHAQGWETALVRLAEEAKAAGANAVLDVKMRTIRLQVGQSMDFTLIGTAVRIEGLPASSDPIICTVPALEFVKLLEADVVPTGIAIGADYEWLTDSAGRATPSWMGNVESSMLSQFWTMVRQRAHAQLQASARGRGNGVLAHTHFNQLFRVERDKQPTRYLGRYIVLATTVDVARGATLPHEVKMVIDIRKGATPLAGLPRHHQSYRSNDTEGAI